MQCAHKVFGLRGSGLITAFAILSLISLALLGLIRTVETNMLIIGNHIYKRSTLYSTEKGLQAAIEWLVPRVQSSELNSDRYDDGYYASYGSDVVFNNRKQEGGAIFIDWDNSLCDGSDAVFCLKAKKISNTGSETNEIQYVIHRLCKTKGSPDDAKNNCKRNVKNLDNSPQRGQISYGQSIRYSNSEYLYYVITTRVKGAKNSISIVQTIVHF
jgi:type IV pilus assembly protein PilX